MRRSFVRFPGFGVFPDRVVDVGSWIGQVSEQRVQPHKANTRAH
jgi:hypothetical protein